MKASEFDPSNPEHIYYLKKMGITLVTQADGKMQLVHSTNAVSLCWLDLHVVSDRMNFPCCNIDEICMGLSL